MQYFNDCINEALENKTLKSKTTRIILIIIQLINLTIYLGLLVYGSLFNSTEKELDIFYHFFTIVSAIELMLIVVSFVQSIRLEIELNPITKLKKLGIT